MLVRDDITNLLVAWRAGDPGAVQLLLPAVYDELRRIAAGAVASNAPLEMGPTELVHESFLRLADGRIPQLEDRRHFYALAARLMRFVLVDQARRLRRMKRNGALVRLDAEDGFSWNAMEDHLALHHCLERLEEFSQRKAEIVELRFFGGLELQEIAEAMGISLALVKRELLMARAWMARELESDVTGHEA